LTSAAANSDIVIHCGDSDHLASLNALITGLLSKPTPGHLIHLSGTGIVSDHLDPTHLGSLNPKIWSDTTSLDQIRSLPDTALHRATEKLLHSTAAQHSTAIYIAIICPPDIYGPGLGPGKRTSAFIPLFVNEILASQAKKAFTLHEGANTRSWVHIADLMRLYRHVIDATQSSSPEKFFNKEGYYFGATQEVSQRDVAVAVGGILHRQGCIPSEEVVEVSLSEMDCMANFLPQFPLLGRYLFAGNSRTRADRAGGMWGYEAREKGLMECLDADVLEAVGARKK
jgi:nucleoside-diphosphate-sugar epimerase